jgi:Putative zinc- or iron-chelating domain
MSTERIPLLVLDEQCRSCGSPVDDGHDVDCPLADHEAMLSGDEDAKLMHDPDGCYWCVAERPATLSQCRCGECCRRQLIEVDTEDARREPKIAERASPIFTPAILTASGRRELEGFLLNSEANDGACVFLDPASNLCQIYDTRPLVCRLFNCDQIDAEE